MEGEEIIGGCALLTNDIVSRQDLMPWFACLFVKDNFRSKGLAAQLLNHGLEETKKLGFETLYLLTDMIGFYEKNGWDFLCIGYDVAGKEQRIYQKHTVTR